MPQYLDPTGRSTYGIAVCARCNRKFFLHQLRPDPNTPGLYVCEEDSDNFDPYRLPARQPENIALPFTRPDESLGNGLEPPGVVNLVGSWDATNEEIDLIWTEAYSLYGIASYTVERSEDGGAWTVIATIGGRTYSDATVDRELHEYSYRVSATDVYGDRGPESNEVDFAILPPATGINYVLASAGAGEVWKVSEDGLIWTNIAEIGSASRVIWLPNYSRWVAVGLTNIWICDDPAGVVWTNVTPTGWGGSTVVDVDYDRINDVLCALADSGEIFRSTNGGSNWTQVFTLGGATLRSIYHDYDFDLWFAPSEDATGVDLWTSPTGATWTEQGHVNTTAGGTTYKTTGGKGTEVINFGIASNTGDVQRTVNGTTLTNNGDMINADALYGGFNGQYYGAIGTSGANRTFQRSATATAGSWTSVTVVSTATGGNQREVQPDATRDKWWHLCRRRLFRSDVSNGATWNDSGLVGTFFNALGVKPAPATPISFNVTVAALGGSAYGYENGVGGSVSPSPANFPNGAEMVIVQGFGASGFEFFIITQLLHPSFTEVVVETAGGDVTLQLCARDDGYTDPAESWYYFTNNLWSVADVGQVRTVTFR